MFLELRHLRSLQAIQETGSLARAAERLCITQSALSHQIKALENYFSVPLFFRQVKPLRLTAAGEKVVATAQIVLPEVQALEVALKQVSGGEAGRLHIAIECHACFDWLMPVLDRHRTIWPDIEVDIKLGLSFDAITALKKGDVDLVISSDHLKTPDLVFTPLFDYQPLAVLSVAHPLRHRKKLHPEDFQTETLITYPVHRNRLDVFQHFLTPANVEPAAIRQVELTALILMLVASQRGLAVLPDWVLRDTSRCQAVITKPLAGRRKKGKLYAVVRKPEIKLQYLQDFMHMAKEHHA